MILRGKKGLITVEISLVIPIVIMVIILLVNVCQYVYRSMIIEGILEETLTMAEEQYKKTAIKPDATPQSIQNELEDFLEETLKHGIEKDMFFNTNMQEVRLSIREAGSNYKTMHIEVVEDWQINEVLNKMGIKMPYKKLSEGSITIKG